MRVHRFMRRLFYSIMKAMFRVASKGASFKSVVNAIKKVELIRREKVGDPKRDSSPS